MTSQQSTREISSLLSKRIGVNVGVIFVGVALVIVFGYFAYVYIQKTWAIIKNHTDVTKEQLSLEDPKKTSSMFNVDEDNEHYTNAKLDAIAEQEYSNFTKKLAEVKEFYKKYNNAVVQAGKEQKRDGKTDVVDEKMFLQEHDDY
jgi:hypothetical protein